MPWRVTRRPPTHPVLTNAGDARADHVRVFTLPAPRAGHRERFGSVHPGEAIEICLCGLDLDSTVVTVAWFQRGGEYVWRFVL